MDTRERQRRLLDEVHQWPTAYTFKFIVPAERVADVEAILPDGATIQHRASSGGRYVSVTGVAEMTSADAVLAVYDAARAIDGIIGL